MGVGGGFGSIGVGGVGSRGRGTGGATMGGVGSRGRGTGSDLIIGVGDGLPVGDGLNVVIVQIADLEPDPPVEFVPETVNVLLTDEL